MQFSSRYDGRRLPARPSFTLARCFKSLVDWFDYAYAVVPAAAAWVRNPSFHSRGRRSPAVIHLRGTFGREAAIAPNYIEKPRRGVSRSLAKFGLFAAVLTGAYLVFALAAGGPSHASAPTYQAESVTMLNSSFAGSTGQRVFEFQPSQGEETVTAATPVKTLQSAIEAMATSASVTAAETSADAVQPIAAPVAAATPVATAEPEVHTAAAPVATPAPKVAAIPASAALPASTFYTAGEIRSFAAAAGWSSDQLDAVVQVAWCESTYNAAAIGASGARGLMQIMPLWFTEAGVDLASWSDPVTNLRVALVAFHTRAAESGGDPWSAWDCRPSH